MSAHRMAATGHAPARAQQGQAMVEFIVAALFFLVPLFLAIAAFGKFTDVRHTTTMAARYAAWERTVWYDDAGTEFDAIHRGNHKSAAAIGNELAVRLINDRSSAATVIKNTDQTATSFVNGTDPLWRDNAGTAYLDRYAQRTSSVGKAAPASDIAGRALGLFATLPLPSFMTGPLVPPLPNDTLAVARVSLNQIASNSDAYQRLWPAEVWSPWSGLDFSATGAILSNTWYANGAGATEEMVKRSVPTANGFGRFVWLMTMPDIGQWDPTIPSRLRLGKIAPDVVPADRLR
jgi:Flp pilus assembly protein TadG